MQFLATLQNEANAYAPSGFLSEIWQIMLLFLFYSCQKFVSEGPEWPAIYLVQESATLYINTCVKLELSLKMIKYTQLPGDWAGAS